MSTHHTEAESLSEHERALLRSAVREGYFEIPRETTLTELAEHQDMSDRAVSEVLRAGLDTVVREAVLDGEGKDLAAENV